MKKRRLPTRIARFCCKVLKESYGGRNERLVTGVRRDESVNRRENQGVVAIFRNGSVPDEVKNNEDFKQRKAGYILLNYDNDESVEIVYKCFRTNKVLVNPLINWTEDDVWKYINDEKIPYNPLYDCGFSRVGCVGCPMATFKSREKQLERYPKYKERYIRIAERLVEWRKSKMGSSYYGPETGLQYFKRWMEDPNTDGQMSIDEFGNITEDYT